MATNILALPIAHLTIETGNNEDWIDAIQYLSPDDKPIDLRGINFEMEIRRRPFAHEVVLRASSDPSMDGGWISIGTPPNFGHLIISVPEKIMRDYFAGEYVGDIRARADNFYRRLITMDLLIVEGITKSKRRWFE